MREQGADILDVGAESTLAQAARVDEAGQNSKLLPVIRALRESGALVSVETYQPAVTRACLEAGANILNLTGTERTDELFRMVAAPLTIVVDRGGVVRYVHEDYKPGDEKELDAVLSGLSAAGK